MLSAKKELFTPSGGGYQISRSVRLRSSASAYFNRTFTTPTNVLKWSWSGWVKRGQIGVTYAPIFAGGTSGSAYAALWFNNDNLVLYSYNGATVYQLTTSAVYRDPSAWYHIQIAFDSTQATASNRLAMYVNGVQITAFAAATYPSLNYSGFMNSAIAHYFGQFTPALGASYFDGYLTEINFIDGQALTPSSFGETNAVTGVWQPKRYAGTYGTNGFYLNFSDNSGVTATTIGKDYSGNGNNWTPSAGISITAGATYDSMLDVPTPYADGGNGRGNYAVVNPLSLASSTTLSEANLKGVSSTFNNLQSGTVAVSSGKWYWELTFGGSLGMVGIVPASAPPTTDLGYTATSYGYRSSTGTKYNNGSATAYGNTYTTNDVIGVALDLDNGKLFFSKNNTWQNSGDPAAGTNAAFTGLSGSFMPAAGTPDTTAATWYWNFGQRPFTYTPPTGFVALNTQNLPTPTILKGNQYFDASLWTGTGTNPRTLSTGVIFQPDLVWVKARSAGVSHALHDSVRGFGVSTGLVSNLTGAEGVAAVNGGVTTVGIGSLTLNAGSTDAANVNNSTVTYVGWQWNAGGTSTNITVGQYGTSPNVPSIASTVRANATAGFSVVTYTGTGAVSATVGHGLNVAPKFVIVKQRTSAGGTLYNWNSYHEFVDATPADYFISLNTTNGKSLYTLADLWSRTKPTNSVFTLGSATGGANTINNFSGTTYVAYCFAAVAGYSAFGSYTGNGSADGPFVFTGFRPRFVLIKRSDSTGNWFIWDTSRNTFNAVNNQIYPDSSSAEAVQDGLDFLSNGFKIRFSSTFADRNANGGTYIYMAFAENPFKNSLAR